MTETWHDLITILSGAGVKLLVAVVCGFLLGLERESRHKPAGLRTIILITVGSTLFMILSELIPFVTDWPEATSRVDPSRIAAGVVQGIGFLGAGSIIQARGEIHGLTTAAVIWVAAGVGLCAGIGYPLLAIVLTLAVLAVLVVLDPLRRWLARRGPARMLELVVPNDTIVVRRLQLMLQQHDIRRDEIDMQPMDDERLHVTVTYFAGSAGATSRLLDTLANIEGVKGTPLKSAD